MFLILVNYFDILYQKYIAELSQMTYVHGILKMQHW